MLRLGLAACAMAALALAQEFAFTIGSPVAAQDFRAKGAAFVFRTQGCADPAKSQISARAEGLVKGVRRSVALKVEAMAKPGIYAVYQTWPAEGRWVVTLNGTCHDSSAGAIVPIGPKGFVRESSKFFSRPAAHVEIEASLKALAKSNASDDKGGNK
ncbi:MAG: hypothetical protein ABSF54_01820 [Bryobacteraceae bacterium]|jgi:hypothetical protein